MQNWPGLAVLLGATVWSQFAAAQSSNPAAPPSGLTGTGPHVDVQTSPNGTLDVGGARGTDVDLTGENFRGSFGASRSQTGPGLPTPSLPGSGRRPFGSPNFRPSLPGGSSRVDVDRPSAMDDEIGVSDLILPRFRGSLGGNALPSSVRPAEKDSWRYQFFRGRWWYWQPAQAWVYWDGWQWRSFAQHP